MKKLFLVGFWVETAILIFILLFVFSTINKVDYLKDFPKEAECRSTAGIDLSQKLKEVSIQELDAKFPYNEFLEKGNYCSISDILGEIDEMNSVRDTIINQIVLSKALTEKLYDKWSVRNKFNLDEVFLKLNWIEKFNQYKEVDERYKTFFSVVYKFWMDKISNDLAKLYDQNNDIKFDSKFNHLIVLCESKRFHVNIGNTKTEKFIDNLKETKFAYILNRLLLDLSPFVLILVAVFSIVTLYGQYLVISKIISFIKKYKS
jgi:hypothetical protein